MYYRTGKIHHLNNDFVPKQDQPPVKKQPRGLGDTLAGFFEAVGVKRLVDAITPKGKSCGCKKRQEKLNKLFPYK